MANPPPPLTPALTPTDFSLFPPPKLVLMGRRFNGATDVIKNAKMELKMFRENVFHVCFQQLYSRWQKCIFAQKDNFDGIVA